MKFGLLAKKVGMTKIFREDGEAVPATVLEVQPSVVTQVKTVEKDGYCSVQLGYGEQTGKRMPKAQKVVCEKLGIPYKDVLYEMRWDEEIQNVQPGDSIDIENFEVGDMVDVKGVSVGKGFQGVVKRHHFSGGRGSHGDKTGRRGGSIGQSSYPSRVFKGMKMPGRMGGRQVTVQNLEVLNVDIENHLLVVKGPIPGAGNNFVRVNIALKEGKDKEIKIKKVALPEKNEEKKKNIDTQEVPQAAAPVHQQEQNDSNKNAEDKKA
ncbi:MAG: 50S ribosomal protein L3 [Candidatus Omnitrophica bacterium]|nr:50S ribosomal protein L3 [Candidatus Omnitrophota bacterium]